VFEGFDELLEIIKLSIDNYLRLLRLFLASKFMFLTLFF
jgi:hypothetical protein